MSKKIKMDVSNLSKKFEEIKDKQYYGDFKSTWKANHSISPLKVVTDFIKLKGLKLYGGLALHKHLKKKGEPIYKDSEFPDYDVFSPNAWEHAKELCDILYKMGYYFVEARASILNDDHHQTYKVSVDMIYVLDLTQVGCTVSQMKNKDCEKCSVGKKDMCVSLFNNIPVYDITYSPKTKNPEIYKETYNYDTDKSYYPRKMFVCSPDWLKISMYREITEPIANPGRLEKVSTRLAKFEKHFKLKKYDCTKKRSLNNIKTFDYTDVLKTINDYIKKKKLIHYGNFAYNFYVKNSKKNIPQVDVKEHEVYVDGLEDTNDSVQFILLDILKNKYPKLQFVVQEKLYYWKDMDSDNYVISVRRKRVKEKFTKLINFTKITECMPYIKYGGYKFATFDRMKHVYLRRSTLPEIYKFVNMDYHNNDSLTPQCILQNLNQAKKSQPKSKKKNKNNKFRSFVLQCDGSQYPRIWGNLMSRFSSKIQQTKKTTYKVNYPERGLMTKIYPLPSEDIKFPYIPAEKEIKKYEYY